jgi:hypothetical protein
MSDEDDTHASITTTCDGENTQVNTTITSDEEDTQVSTTITYGEEDTHVSITTTSDEEDTQHHFNHYILWAGNVAIESTDKLWRYNYNIWYGRYAITWYKTVGTV